MGHVRGLYVAFENRRSRQPTQQLLLAPSPTFVAQLSAKLNTQLDSLLEQHRALQARIAAHADSAAPFSPEAAEAITVRFKQLNTQLEDVLLTGIALLVWATEEGHVVDHQELLHIACRVPSHIFTSSCAHVRLSPIHALLCIAAIHAAVFAWEWVLITDKAFEVPLMVEMKSAWAYTVDRQYGLFSQTTRPITGALGSTLLLTCGLLAEAPQRADDPLHQLQLRIRHDQLQAHTIWIEFLTERFKVVRACNAETVNALSTIMHKVSPSSSTHVSSR